MTFLLLGDGSMPQTGLLRLTVTGYIHTLQNVFETLEELGLSDPPPKPEPRKRGRKPKVKDLAEVKPKRPKKNPTPAADAL